jgi:endonuclease G
MKKLLLLLLLPLTVAANPIDDKCPQFAVYGAPVSQITDAEYLCKANYAVHYRNDTKTAEYVVEHVTKEAIHGGAQRANDFHPDDQLPQQYQSRLNDYAGQPYDRGHLAPAGDNTQNDAIMSESFAMSNMVPQVPNNNRGIWNHLEGLVRIWVDEGKDIYVVTGTFYQHGNHKAIGKDHVGIPTHLWKAVYDHTNKRSIAFLIPNDALPVNSLPNYAMSVFQLESIVGGIDIMPNLTDDERNSIEHVALPKYWKGL